MQNKPFLILRIKANTTEEEDVELSEEINDNDSKIVKYVPYVSETFFFPARDR